MDCFLALSTPSRLPSVNTFQPDSSGVSPSGLFQSTSKPVHFSAYGPQLLVVGSVISIVAVGRAVSGHRCRSNRSSPRLAKCRVVAMHANAVTAAPTLSADSLPPCACRGTIRGVEVIIIGTAHIAAQSAKDVEKLLADLKPDGVVVELSRDRMRGLFNTAILAEQAESLLVDIQETPRGFTDVLTWSQVKPGADVREGQEPVKDNELVLRGPKAEQVERIQLPGLGGASYSAYDEQWINTLLDNAIKKYRYQGRGYELMPAVSFLAYLAQSCYQIFVRTFYLSIGTAKRTGSEFVAASDYCQNEEGCQLVLGDVVDEELFNFEGTFNAARNESPLVWLLGPLLRPSVPNLGVDVPESILHIFGAPGFLSQISTALWLATQLFFVLQPGGVEYFLLNIAVLLLAAAYTYLLTADRDERLFLALDEAASRAAAARQSADSESLSAGTRGRVVMVCGLAHVNGIARRVANAPA